MVKNATVSKEIHIYFCSKICASIFKTYFFDIKQKKFLGIAQIAEAGISIGRIEKFLLYDETVKPLPASSNDSEDTNKADQNGKSKNGLDLDVNNTKKETNTDGVNERAKYRHLDEEENKEILDDVAMRVRSANPSKDFVISLSNVCAKWTLDQTENTLTDLTMKIKPGRYLDLNYI